MPHSVDTLESHDQRASERAIQTPRLLALLAVIWLAGVLSAAHPRSVGDASEYVAMAVNLAALRPPALADADFAHFDQTFAPAAGAFELRTRRLPELVGSDGRQDMPHMWVYSLLAAPFVRAASGVGAGPPWAFVALNALLLAALTALALRQGGGAWSLAIVAMPVIWWVDKPLADLFIAVCLGLAVLWWPTQGPAALAVLGIGAAQNPALGVAWLVFAVTAVAADPRRLRQRAWWVGASVGAACAALGPAYYLWHLGRPSPLTTYVGLTWPAPSALLFPLADVNMGALIRFPPGALLIGFALLRRDGWKRPAALPAAATALLLLAVISQQPNMNQGGNPDLSRYAIWLLPLALPWLLAADAAARSRPALRRTGLAGLFLCAAWTAVAFPPSRPESYRYPTPLASWVWAHHPAWTMPRPEAFAERTSHREPGLVPTATPGCEKVLLVSGWWPASCPPGAVEVPAACAQPNGFCYADTPRGGPTRLTPVGRRGWLGPDVHDRIWQAGDPAAAWLAGIVEGLEAGWPDDLGVSRRAVWDVAWSQTWHGAARVVLYARDAGPGARIVLRHVAPVRIVVRTPATAESPAVATPAAEPTVVPLPVGEHVVVDISTP